MGGKSKRCLYSAQLMDAARSVLFQAFHSSLGSFLAGTNYHWLNGRLRTSTRQAHSGTHLSQLLTLGPDSFQGPLCF